MAFPKCCKNCQDYKYCDEKCKCCEFCDYSVNNKCSYQKFKKNSLTVKIYPNLTISNYRGDDYGIDDYNEYEELG